MILVIQRLLRLVGSGTPEDDVALVAAALAGRPAAVKTLAGRLAPILQARARRFLRGMGYRIAADEVDDLIQEIWLVLLKDDGRHLRAWDPARGASLEGYVGMVADRELRNQLAARRRLKRGGDQVSVGLEGTEGTPGGEAAAEGELIGRDLEAALGRHLEGALSDLGRMVHRLLYHDGLAPAEAAAVLRVNTQVVYNWQHKIRQVSRSFLAEQEA